MNALAFVRYQVDYDNLQPIDLASSERTVEREASAIYADEDRLQGLFEEHYVGCTNDELVAELRELHMLLRENYRRLHGLSETSTAKTAADRAWNDLKQRAATSTSFVEGLVTDEAKFRVGQGEG